MRVLLLATNKEVEPYPTYPLGMSVVASALQQHGHEVLQADFLCHTKPLQTLLHQFLPQMIGISIRNIDNVDMLTPDSHWALDAVKQVVKIIRTHTPGVPIILGGPAVSIMPQAICDYCQADCAVAGEGELSVTALVQRIEQGLPLPRVVISGTTLSGASISAPSFDPTLLEYYAQASGVVNLHTKRGCPNNCIYCTYPSLEGKTIRTREPEAVIEDIRRLQSTISFTELFFTDSVFNDTEGHWLTLVEMMVQRNIVVPWTAFFQPTGLERDHIALCKATGLKAVELGTDACANITLKAMGKNFSFATAHKATESCVAENIPCCHFVIVGGPGETKESLREGLDNLNKLPPCLVMPFLGVRILPGTPLHSLAIRHQVITQDNPCLLPTYYFSPQLTQEEAHTMLLASFRGNRLRLYPPAAAAQKMRALRGLGYRGILWDTLVHLAR
ncbi:MAG: radical SAM protein [Desulfovibrionales bacterium]|nr:radical SAM protein [Desulfovibrionales bacterium]